MGRVLKEAGVIVCAREGRHVVCRPDPAAVRAAIDAVLKTWNLSHGWPREPGESSSGGETTVACLARDLETDPASMTRALDRLEAKGLVVRERSTTDRRVVQLALTEEGRTVAALVPAVLSEVLNGHLTGFSHAEWQSLLGMLRRMLVNGEALRQQAVQPLDTPR